MPISDEAMAILRRHRARYDSASVWWHCRNRMHIWRARLSLAWSAARGDFDFDPQYRTGDWIRFDDETTS